MSTKMVHASICGDVQAVGFRYSAKQLADKLGINGWIKNNHDGTVELMVCGNKPEVLHFLKWCQAGPEHADVSSVDILEETMVIACQTKNFVIR